MIKSIVLMVSFLTPLIATGQTNANTVRVSEDSIAGQESVDIGASVAKTNAALMQLIQERVAEAISERIQQKIGEKLQRKIDEKMRRIDDRLNKRVPAN